MLSPEEIAAKEAAEAAKKKEAADKEAKKQADLQAKVQAATETVTREYNNLTGIVAGVGAVVAGVDASNVEATKQAEAQCKEQLKIARGSLKLIREQSRKFKDNEELKGAVTAAEGLVAEVEKHAKSFGEIRKAFREEEKIRKAAEAEAKKAASQMPEQNGVRRPRPDSLCGQAWALMDECSSRLQQPVPVSFVLQLAPGYGLNEGNIKTEYARWKKFNAVDGRVDIPLPEVLKDLLKEPVAQTEEASEA